MSSRPQLDYGRQATGARRHAIKLVIAAGFALSAVLFARPLYREFVVPRVQEWKRKQALRALQAQCKTYSLPETQLAYEENPERVDDLLRSDRAWESTMPLAQQVFGTHTFFKPTTLPSIEWHPPVIYVPPLWTTCFGRGGIVLLHGRRTPRGEERLVLVGIVAFLRCSTDGTWSISRSLQAHSIVPGAEFPGFDDPNGLLQIGGQPGSEGITPLGDDSSAPFGRPFPMRLYAAKIDPRDASRFTVRYVFQNRDGIISGQLRDDGSVLMIPEGEPHVVRDSVVHWTP